MRLPDFSEYLVGDKLLKEEEDWSETKHYEKYAEIIMTATKLFDLGKSFTLLELGCGSGWVPTMLDNSITYFGVDKNEALLEMARKKNNDERIFFRQDIRKFKMSPRADVVCSFAVLKHFGLDEWEDIFRRMLRMGRYGAFSIQVTYKKEPFDDGIDYHHVWVTEDMIENCALAEGKFIRLIQSIPRSGFDRFFFIGGKG